MKAQSEERMVSQNKTQKMNRCIEEKKIKTRNGIIFQKPNENKETKSAFEKREQYNAFEITLPVCVPALHHTRRARLVVVVLGAAGAHRNNMSDQWLFRLGLSR